MKRLNEAASGQMSLVKMLIVKADENHSAFSRLRSCFQTGEWEEAERLLTVLEESNHASLTELQTSDRSLLQTAVLLTEHLKTEKLEHTQALRELGQAGRSRKEASSSPAGRNAASPSAAQGQAEQHIADLRR